MGILFGKLGIYVILVAVEFTEFCINVKFLL